MRKNYLLIFLVFLLFFWAIYSIYWNINAKKLKNIISKPNSFFVVNDKNHSNYVLVRGYPFKFTFLLPSLTARVNSNSQIIFKEVVISSSILNYKKLTFNSRNLKILTSIDNIPIEFKSNNSTSKISFNNKKKFFFYDQKLSDSEIKINYKNNNIIIGIKEINIQTNKHNQSTNLKINLFDTSVPMIQDLIDKKNSISLDISINNYPNFKLSNYSLDLWRKERGTIKLNKIEFNNNKINVRLNGLLRIDKEFYPNGNLKFISNRPYSVINYLYKLNLINSIHLAILKIYLKISNAKGSNYSEIPINLKEKKLYIDKFAISDLHSIKKYLP